MKSLIRSYVISPLNLDNEPSLLKVTGSVTLIGDIHGQYADLLKILDKSEKFLTDSNEKVVFLGDYVDRGINSVEVITLLMLLKINYPNQISMLRGNHESRNMAELYNFKTECCEKYNQDIYDRIMHSFDSLPLAAIVN